MRGTARLKKDARTGYPNNEQGDGTHDSVKLDMKRGNNLGQGENGLPRGAEQPTGTAVFQTR